MRERQTVTGSFDTVFDRLSQQRPSCVGAYSTTAHTLTYGGVRTTKTIVDTETPGFYSLLHCGKFLPLNPVVITTVKETRRAGNGDSHSNLIGGCYRNKSTGPTHATSTEPPLDLPDEGLSQLVATDALADAKSTAFDVLTTIAELKETADLIRTNWTRIARTMREIFRLADLVYRKKWKQLSWMTNRSLRRRRSLLARSKELASLWLEYRYGIMPNVYAIQDAIKALELKYTKGQVIRGKSSTTQSLNKSTTGSLVLSADQTVYYSDVWTGSRTYRGSAYVKISDNRVRFGFDPLVTTWERIPFSFIVDWGLKVGNWLKAWSPFSGTETLGVMVSIKDDYTWRHSYSIDFHGAMSGVFTNNDATEKQVKSYTRVPAGAGILPSFNLRLTTERLIDVAALILSDIRHFRYSR